ncbi:MAG: alpha/beta fold hydrolase [Candidatus Tyrphobacter sp.]
MQVLGDGGIPIDVRIDGGGAHVVVLLAGFPLTRDIWDEAARDLARAHRVVRPELRGVRASGANDGPFLMESLASDIAAVLDEIGVRRASIAGHSMGGYVALAFARMFTERVERLALVCSRLSADSAQQAQSRKALADKVYSGDRLALADAYAARLTCDATRASHPEIVRRVADMAAAIDPRGAAALLRGMALRSASDDIAPELTMPVLIIAGECDEIVPLAEARTTARAFPQAELAIAPSAGHVPMLEAPEFTSAALSRWMGRIDAVSESGS